MALIIDLNCDLGEYDDLTHGLNDAQIMPLISSCNIACGGHSGNQQVIEQTIQLAIEHGVNMGAHPSYPDRINFGRQVMHFSDNELKPILRDQIMAVYSAAQSQNNHLAHVKPHGALYNQAAVDLGLALMLAEIMADVDPKLMFYGLAHSMMAQAAEQVGIEFIAEGFADRAYTASRTLQPRGKVGAVINGDEVILKRVLNLIKNGIITTVTGEVVELKIDTLCVHGDHPDSLKTAQTLRQGLTAAGLTIAAPDFEVKS